MRIKWQPWNEIFIKETNSFIKFNRLWYLDLDISTLWESTLKFLWLNKEIVDKEDKQEEVKEDTIILEESTNKVEEVKEIVEQPILEIKSKEVVNKVTKPVVKSTKEVKKILKSNK